MTRGLVSAGLAVVAVASLGLALRAERRRRMRGALGVSPRPRRRVARPPRWIFWVAGAVGAWFVGGTVAGIVGSAAGVGMTLAAPRWLRVRAVRRREGAIEDQLPEVVTMIASAMRSGRSLPQALRLAAEEIGSPLGLALGQLLERTELGDPLDEAIEAWASELDHPDVRLAAGVLELHRRTGGALADALDDLATTLRARRTAAREVRSLTAQARLSATILGLLPIGFFLFMSVIAREDLRAAYETSVGVWAITVGLCLQAAAYLWIRRLLVVDR